MTPQDEQRYDQLQEEALVAWAQDRMKAGKLGDEIKDLIVTKIGVLTKAQAKYLNRQRTFIPFGVTPSFFVEERADQMMLSEKERKGLHALDVYDPAEAKMIIWALEDIKHWLESLPDGSQRYPHLLDAYESALIDAHRDYTILAGHPPLVAKAVNMVMRLEMAKKYVKAWEELR